MLNVSSNLPGWVRGLARRFRAAIDDLVEVVPVTVASLSARPETRGPLEVLASWRVTDGVLDAGPALVLGEPALRWLDRNRRELVLEVRPTHHDVAFYQPFIRAGVKRVLVVPVLRVDAVIGTVLVASTDPDAYTAGDLKRVRRLAGELTPYFPRPAPVTPGGASRSSTPATSEHIDRDAAPRSTSEAVIETDALGRIGTWTGAAEGLFGLASDEVLGSTLAVFYRPMPRRRIDVSLVDHLLAEGPFRGRALCYDSEGLPVTCEVELSRLDTGPGRVRGFRGRFRQVTSETLLPREEIQFDFARLYAFDNRLTGGGEGKPQIHAGERR